MDILPLLRLAHIFGLVLMGAGLIGVFFFDLRSRQLKDLHLFGQTVSFIAVFYDGLVVPGAILLLASGIWLIVKFYGGWDFLQVPWLAGMVLLFALEFIEGNTITRLYFMRLRRLTRDAATAGDWTPALTRARAENLASFTHFLDLPMLLLIISLGVLRPENWAHFLVGAGIVLLVAALVTVGIKSLYPWGEEAAGRGP